MPIHEHNSRALSSLEGKKELMMAKNLTLSSIKSKQRGDKNSEGLISYDQAEDKIKVYS